MSLSKDSGPRSSDGRLERLRIKRFFDHFPQRYRLRQLTFAPCGVCYRADMSRLTWPILTVAALLFAACTSTVAPGAPSPPALIDITATATTSHAVPLETT